MARFDRPLWISISCYCNSSILYNLQVIWRWILSWPWNLAHSWTWVTFSWPNPSHSRQSSCDITFFDNSMLSINVTYQSSVLLITCYKNLKYSPTVQVSGHSNVQHCQSKFTSPARRPQRRISIDSTFDADSCDLASVTVRPTAEKSRSDCAELADMANTRRATVDKIV